MHLIDQQIEALLQGDFKLAWQICEQLEKTLDRNSEMYKRHSFNRGWFLLNQGKFIEGYQHLEMGRHVSTYGLAKPVPTKNNAPIWNPEEHLLQGKKLLLVLEGGFGDEIIHVRFAREFKKMGATVIVRADEALHSLFSRIEGIDQLITSKQVPDVECDYWVPGFSAAWLCGCDFDRLPNEPYLVPDEQSLLAWSGFVDSPKLKVGIRWAGSPKFERQQLRRFPVDPYIEIFNRPEVQLYSLQRDEDLVDLPPGVEDLRHMLESWEDTAAAIAHMDLVVSSCTSVAHLAAAMGKPTWIVVPLLAYHTWALPGKTSPWYRTVKLFRQTQPGNWDQPMGELNADLTSLLEQTMKEPA